MTPYTMRIFNYLAGTSLVFYSAYKVHQCLHANECMISKKQLNYKRLFKRLPDVLVQNVISYVVYSTNIKLTNKRFYKLSEKNDEIELIKAAKLNKQQCFIPDMKHLFEGNKWIVDPHRKHLNSNEKQSGYQGFFEDIITGITQCNHGDKLIIHQGEYVFDESIHWSSNYNKWIMFIGIGKVIIKNIPLQLLTNIHFENIHFDFDADVDDNYWITPMQLSMKHCIWNGISIRCIGNAYFEDCVFNEACLDVTKECEHVVIIGCTFSNIFSCIDIWNRGRKKKKIIIIGNTFKNKGDHPIVSYEYYIVIEDLLIKHNILKVLPNAFTGFVNKDECVNPNKIHKVTIVGDKNKSYGISGIIDMLIVYMFGGRCLSYIGC